MKRWMYIPLSLAVSLRLLTGCADTGTGNTGSSEEITASTDGSADSSEEAAFSTDGSAGDSEDAAASTDESVDDSGSSEASSAGASDTGADPAQTDADLFTDRDYETDYEESGSVMIQLNGVTINSETSAPLYIFEADKVFVTLADGTENILSNGGTFTADGEETIDSVIYSKQDLTLNGSGTLTVTSPAGHGIVAKDDLAVTGGTYKVSSASHGLNANDSVRITGETSMELDTGKDGIHAENNDDTSLGFVYISNGTFDVEAEGDGISAGAYLQIADGSFRILAGGGSENGSSESSDSWGDFRGGRAPDQPEAAAEVSTETTEENSTEASEDSSTSMKGMKASGNLLITGGSFTIDSADDAVHSNTSLTVNGGTFTVASGDDAFHGEETLTVTAGTIDITESYEGLEALDIRVEGGDITLVASDDGLNAAGGTDSSGTTGGRDGRFGGGPGGNGGGTGGNGGGMSSSWDGSIVISGGSLQINASGDGIDANGSVTISGGYTVVTGPTQGDTATLDYDVSAVITGGTFIGTGASGMAQTFSDSEQGVVSVSTGSQSAGTAVTLADQEGNTLITCTPEESFQVVILSSPDLVSGETYTVTVGKASAEVEAT